MGLVRSWATELLPVGIVVEQVLALWRNDRQAIADRRENRPLAGLAFSSIRRAAPAERPIRWKIPEIAAGNPSVPAAAPASTRCLTRRPSAKASSTLIPATTIKPVDKRCHA